MIKKRLRLRAAEVESILKGGRSVRTPHMQLKVLEVNEPFRSAAVVAKALARKANKRNTLRRAIYRAIAGATTPSTLPPTTLLSGHGVFFLQAIPKEEPSAVIANEVRTLLALVQQAKAK